MLLKPVLILEKVRSLSVLSSLAPAAYQVASTIRNTTNKKFKVACRTLEGTSTHPTKVGCWRVA